MTATAKEQLKKTDLKSTMHNQVKHTIKWDTIKALVKMVLVLFSILLCIASWYAWLQPGFKNALNTGPTFQHTIVGWLAASAPMLLCGLIFLWLREIHFRKKITRESLLQKKPAVFIQGVLDALSAQIAVINAAGTMLATNASWNSFALTNGASTLEKCGAGANYFDACKNAVNDDDNIAGKTMDGIKKVLDGSLPAFELEYPCHLPNYEQWFYMRVKRFDNTEPLLVIEHHDITARKKEATATLKAMERYDILARATSDTIWDWDITNDKMLYNSGITNMFGYRIAEINNIAEWWKKKIQADDLPVVMEICNRAIKKQVQNLQLEYRFLCADGSYKYIFDRAFVIYDNQQQAVRMIGAMQDITYAREEEKRMAKAIIDAQDQERHYIGQELHDNVNQLLASSLLTLGMVKHYPNNEAKIAEFADLTKAHTLTALNEIRKLSHELIPARFNESTLKDNFEALFSGINVDGQFNIDFQFDERINHSTSNEVQINLYRILQEQVKNISTYSGADSIEIWVTHTANTVKMRTFDNGRGFDTRKTKKGIGLSNMQRRVESFAGKFLLATQPGKGCEIVIEIPHP